MGLGIVKGNHPYFCITSRQKPIAESRNLLKMESGSGMQPLPMGSAEPSTLCVVISCTLLQLRLMRDSQKWCLNGYSPAIQTEAKEVDGWLCLLNVHLSYVWLWGRPHSGTACLIPAVQMKIPLAPNSVLQSSKKDCLFEVHIEQGGV